ncbi:MAG: hypothetical protein ACE14M_16890 [Terriglobales bacterium]
MGSSETPLVAGQVQHMPLRLVGLEPKLVRAALLMLLLMATAFGGATWNAVQDLTAEVKAIPVLLFVVVCIIVVRMYVEAGKIAKLRQTEMRPQMDAPAAEPIATVDSFNTLALSHNHGSALRDIRTALEILSAVNLLEGSDKDEVERLLLSSVAVLDVQP